MDAEVRAAAERLLARKMLPTGTNLPMDVEAVARYVLAAAERPKGDAAEIDRLREALEDIKLRYDEEGRFAARDMWRVAYEALDARPSPSPEGAARSGHPDDATP